MCFFFADLASFSVENSPNLGTSLKLFFQFSKIIATFATMPSNDIYGVKQIIIRRLLHFVFDHFETSNTSIPRQEHCNDKCPFGYVYYYGIQ